MSNKYLIPLIVAILISTIVAVSVNQFNKFSNNKIAIVSSSSVVITQSSVVSSSSQVSSSSNSSLVVVESIIPKPTIEVEKAKPFESKTPMVKADSSVPTSTANSSINKTCEIPPEMIKYKSNSGCFSVFVNIPYDADDTYPLRSQELADFAKNTLSKDFYDRIKDSSKSPYVFIRIGGASKISENVFSVGMGFTDIEYMKSAYTILTHADRFEGVYIVNLNDPKSLKLDQFTDRTKN